MVNQDEFEGIGSILAGFTGEAKQAFRALEELRCSQAISGACLFCSRLAVAFGQGGFGCCVGFDILEGCSRAGSWTSRFVVGLVVLDSSRAVNGRPEFCELKPWIFHDAHAPNFA